MGQYVVNGEVVDLRQDHPTAANLKQATHSPAGDWVMATLPDGKIQKLDDGEALPAGVTDVSIVPATYGTQEPAPSVVFLNGAVASLPVAEAVKVISGTWQGKAASPILLYDLLGQSVTRADVHSSEGCTTCGTDGLTALTDLSPLQEAAESATAAPLGRRGADA
jgi:hypothetical protein